MLINHFVIGNRFKYAKSSLVHSVACSIIINLIHRSNQICFTSSHTLYDRYQIVLIISIRRFDFFEGTVREVRINSLILMSMCPNVERGTSINHRIIIVSHPTKNRLAILCLPSTNQRIMRKWYGE